MVSQTTTTTSTPNQVGNSYPFFDNMVAEFYEFMGRMYIEYMTKQEEIKKNSENNQSFAGYFLYRLFMDYGVKRRKINEELVMMYYVKSLKGYNKHSHVTQLCRHMVLNLKNMRIVSLGIPKGVSLDTFCETYEIDKNDLSTSVMGLNNEGKAVLKYKVFKFPEGTMVTYNPSMKHLCESLMSTQNINEDDEGDENVATVAEDGVDYKKIVDDKVIQHFEYSTRKNLGTGTFNTKKKFSEMFEENNKIAGTDLTKIPENLIKDTVLVFNVEHVENYMVSNQIKNFNTLCAVYKFKNDDIVTNEYDEIMALNVEDETAILSGFKKLSRGMVTQVHVSVFKNEVKDYVENLNLPELITSFEKKTSSGETEIVPIETIAMAHLEKIVESKNKYFQGYIIYGFNGERTKITNSKYKELRQLKGDKPITIVPWNNKNLFNLYWKLLKNKNLESFIKEFDFPASQYSMNYLQLFNWYRTCALLFMRGLFNSYHNSFVKKTMAKTDIPFPMKPLCGELHKKYMENKLPITPQMVEEFVFNMPGNTIYWRIFATEENKDNKSA